jgi:hypothetical protein
MLTKRPSHANEHIQRANLAGLRVQSAMVASHVKIAPNPRKRAPTARQAGVSAKLLIAASNSHRQIQMSCS